MTIPLVTSQSLALALATLIVGVCAVNAGETSDRTRILVLCTGNSARSQITAGFLKSWDPHLDVSSAGTNPAPRINPFAVRAMKEVGIDISNGQPKSVNQFVDQAFDYVITVCDDADKNCPNFTGKVGHRLHLGFPDPAAATGTDEEKMAVFRKVRDDMRVKFRDLYDTRLSKGI